MIKDVLFKVAMFLRLHDKNECTACYNNGRSQTIADIRNGDLIVYTAPPCCEVHHDEPLVCLRCVNNAPPLMGDLLEITGTVPAVTPLTNIPAAKYVRKKEAREKRVASEKTRDLPPLSWETKERLSKRHNMKDVS